MTTQTLVAARFPESAARKRRLLNFPWMLFLMAALWVTGVGLALRDPAPAEPVLLVLFGAGLIGAASVLARRAARVTEVEKSVTTGGD
jgi:hypothetical protein